MFDLREGVWGNWRNLREIKAEAKAKAEAFNQSGKV